MKEMKEIKEMKRKKIALTAAVVVSCLIICGIGSSFTVGGPERDMPSEVEPGECFNVTINFTLPQDSSIIFLYDEPPSGWDITSIVSSEPPANFSSTDEIVTYIWNVSYPAGTTFSVIYTVCVPEDAAPGGYRFVGNMTYITGYPPLPNIVAIRNNHTSIRAPAAVPTISPIGIVVMLLLLTAVAISGIRRRL